MVIRESLGNYQVEVETGGYVRFDVQLTNSPHRHDYFEICLVLEGAGTYFYGSESYRLNPGDVLLAEPGVVHEITSFDTKDLFLYFITLSMLRLDLPEERSEENVVEAFSRGRRVYSEGHNLLRNYLPLLSSSSDREVLAPQLLKLFALELLKALTKVEADVASKQSHSEMERLFDFVDRNLDRRLSVEEVAVHLGVSERTLRRRFRARAGLKLSDEINHRRMRRAAHRLLMGFSVAEVADYSGIADPAQFTRSFSRAFGIPPKKFQSTYLPGTLARTTRPPD